MAKLNAGEIVVPLNGSDRILRPTLDAIQAVSRLHGGLAGARDALAAQNFDTVCAVLIHGLGLKTDADRKALPKAVFKNGLNADLLVPLIKFVAVLGNGGRPIDDDEETVEGGDDTGNV